MASKKKKLTGFNIPRYYYKGPLQPSDATDYLQFEVVRPVGKIPGHATLILDAQSPGKPGPNGGSSLTNVEITVDAPTCTIKDPKVTPVPSGLTMSSKGTKGWCTWHHHKGAKKKQITYQVPFTTSTSKKNALRFEFILRANELVRPVRIQSDLLMTAQIVPETISVPRTTTVKAKPKLAGKSAEATA